MQNINIKAIFIEENLANDEIKKKIESEGTTVILARTADLHRLNKEMKTPIFNRCAIGGNEFIDTAKEEGIRTLNANADTLMSMDVKNFLECGRPIPYEVDDWSFIANEIDTEDIGHLESIFALGNGYLGLRGTFDEQDENIPEISGMYINGIFETEPIVHPWPCKGFAKNEQYTVNLCDWRIIEVYIDGEKACYSNGINNHSRRLDFLHGEIVRNFEFTSKSGKKVKVESVRVVNLNRSHSAEIKYTVTSLNFEGEVKICSKVIKNTVIIQNPL